MGALSSAPWPIQLASGLVVVLLHLLVAEVLLRSPAASLSPPKPPVCGALDGGPHSLLNARHRRLVNRRRENSAAAGGSDGPASSQV